MNLVTFNGPVTAGNRTMVEDNSLVSLDDPAMLRLAETDGDRAKLLQGYPV